MPDEKIDATDQILIAIYAEYQRPIPNMNNVKSRQLGIDSEEFKFALVKLQNEGLISDMVITGKQPFNYTKPFEYSLNSMLPTAAGIEKAEQLLEITERSTAKSRLCQARKQLGLIGLELLKAFVTGIASEIV